ncbi:Uncharacterised protein [Klebsiella pneumoniae]|uniref:Uncharacterized protein n=1 Tax=Klebsiella pneumoniae TaxID=573 RepID=A0A377XI55_KLEPN|nr:Uncharacterised protein [Klebsiella pneumoniae]STV68991.1 Uncharacterised protein [Klebsiella pneumoniae subsp. rhinoscleromatis]STT82398.1 Uncharacterised protein [Klebsiella pneumoniae]STU10028.1 Uncharacterised protein [Klebsiella pneumoniae]STW10956.1 Uncharacterised protein [Klebsiella pneumoniae subsp. rhinoscleromatis]
MKKKLTLLWELGRMKKLADVPVAGLLSVSARYYVSL